MSLNLRSFAISALATGSLLAPASSFASATTYMYITEGDYDRVRIVDTDGYDLLGVIDVGDAPGAIAISGTGAYVANGGDDTVTVIDVTDNQVVATVSVGDAPRDIVISGTGAFVVNGGANTVTVIDITDNQVVSTVNVGTSPRHIAASGTGVYVTNNATDNMTIIDITDNQVVATVLVGDGPVGIAISGTGAYVALNGEDAIEVIDITDNLSVKTIAASGAPDLLAITGTSLYYSIDSLAELYLVDVETEAESGYPTLLIFPRDIVINGDRVYVMGVHYIHIVDASTVNQVDALDAIVMEEELEFADFDGLAFYSDTTPPDPPSDFEAEATGDDVHFTWVNPTDPDFATVSIFGSTSAYPTDTMHGGAVVTGTASTYWDISNLADGTYYYSIFAVDTNGNLSSAANALVTVDTSAPAALTTLNALAFGSDVQLSWSVSADAGFDEYVLRRSSTAYPASVSDGTLVTTTGGTSHTDTGLANGTYFYGIFVKDDAGNYSSPTMTTITVGGSTATTGSTGGGRRSSGTGRTDGGSSASSTPSAKSSDSQSSLRSYITVTKDEKTQVFTDVYTDDWFGSYVKKLVEFGIFSGYADKDGKPLNLYGPADSITIGQLAKVAAIMIDAKVSGDTTGDDWALPYMKVMKDAGFTVFAGNVDFKTVATRAQVIQAIVEASNLPKTEALLEEYGITLTDADLPYSDVPKDSPYALAIAVATKYKIIGGDEGKNTFRPNDPVNRAEVAKMVVLTLAF